MCAAPQEEDSKDLVWHGHQAVIPVRIRRDHVLLDGFNKLHHLRHKLKNRILVTFVDSSGVDEAGVDGGGLFKVILRLCDTVY